MITIHLRYQIDPFQLEAFTAYAQRWITLVNKHGGNHHGYFMPLEGDSDEAFALFTFDSLAAYELYRRAAEEDPECLAAYTLARDTGCIVRYERRIQRPVFQGV